MKEATLSEGDVIYVRDGDSLREYQVEAVNIRGYTGDCDEVVVTARRGVLVQVLEEKPWVSHEG